MVFTNLKPPGASSGTDDGNTATSTAFGEPISVELTPVAQGDFVHGINPQVFNSNSFAGGTTSVEQNMAVLESGTSPSGSAVVQLRRTLKYKPGQGAMMRATALFGTGSIAGSHPATSAQFIGMGNSESGYFVGYFGGAFGILHSKTGAREVQTLTIGAAAGTEDVTVTLNGDSIVVPVTGGASTTQTAYQLAQANYRNLGPTGWIADVKGSTVTFISARAGSYSGGTFSVASGGSIGGTFAQTIAGVAQENDFILQSQFNEDTLDGNGPSGMIFNPDKGNVFQIGFQYLGFGNANFSIEDPQTGLLSMFHRIKNANALEKPVLKNPNVSILATSSNIGPAPESVKLKTASMVAFTEGKVAKLDPKFAKSRTFTSSETFYQPALLLKVDRIFNNLSCYGSFQILKIAGSNDSPSSTPKTLTIGLFLNEVIDGDVDFQAVKSGESLVCAAELDLVNNTIPNASATPFYELVVGAGSSNTVDLSDLDFSFGPGETVLVAVKGSDGTNIAGGVSLNWYEQQ